MPAAAGPQSCAGALWNASLSPRIGYVGAQPTVLADARLRVWSEAAGLTCAAPEDPTWSSYNESGTQSLTASFTSRKTAVGGLCLLPSRSRHWIPVMTIGGSWSHCKWQASRRCL